MSLDGAAYVFRGGDDDEDVDVEAAAADPGLKDQDDDARTVATGATALTTAIRRKIDVNDVPFRVLCELLNRFLISNKRNEKETKLQAFWRALYKPNVSLFPVMRLLLPQLDSDRSTYGLRESSLGDAYIAALGLTKTLDQAQRLKNYKQPYRAGRGGDGGAGVSGDFALVLRDVLSRYVSVSEGASKLTIGDVNDMLDRLAHSKDKGSPDRAAVFTRCVTELSPNDNLWFSRIIMKDLKIGMRQETVLKLFDRDAEDIYNSCSSLKFVCEQVAQPSRQKHSIQAVQYFAPCKPMLASNPPWQSIVARMKGNPFYVEPKFDGERIILHKKGSEVKLFTRKSIDYTNRYNYGSAFIPVVLDALSDQDCIIDGELLTFDTMTQTYMKFGSNRTIALGTLGPLGSTMQLCYKAFDILMLGDEVLVHKPLHERRVLLHATVKTIKQRFEVIDCRTDITTSPAVLEALNESCAAGHEGIIVKNASSPYLLNDRSDAWIKMKPDYVDGLRDTMDLVLLGGYYGEGVRRTGGVSHFLLGVLKDPVTERDAERYKDRKNLPPPIYTFCKVGSGYSIPRLKELRIELDSKFQKYDPKNQPKHFMDWRHERSDIPDVWIDPRDSVIFEIKCYEITPCRPNKFSAGYTCRFPRVVQIRSDKDWSDSMTRQQVVELAEPGIPQTRAALDSYAAGDAGLGLRQEDAIKTEDARIKIEEEPLPVVEQPHSIDWQQQALEEGGTTAPLLLGNAEGASPSMAGADLFLGGEDAAAAGRWAAGDDDGGMAAAMAAAGLPVDPGADAPKKKGRKRKAVGDGLGLVSSKKAQVLSLFTPTDVSNVGPLVSTIFENKSFCVMSTDRTPTKADLERLIALHGGRFTQNPMPQTFCLLAKAEETHKVAVQKKAKNKDIIHYSWLVDSASAGHLLPFTTNYVIQGTDATMKALARESDTFGDSFTQNADRESLLGALTECSRKFTHPFEGGAERPIDSHRGKVPRTLIESELNHAQPAPASYHSQLLRFTPEQRRALSTPATALGGSEVWVYGKQDTPGVRLAVVTLQLLGARVTQVLHAQVTHILHVPMEEEDGENLLDSLQEVLPSFNLHIVPPLDGPPSFVPGACQLVDLGWVERQRQIQTEDLAAMMDD